MSSSDVGFGIFIAVVAIAFVVLSVVVYTNLTENSKEYDELRDMDCSNPPELLRWADKHTKWLDHQTYARQLFVVCTVGGEKPTLNH